MLLELAFAIAQAQAISLLIHAYTVLKILKKKKKREN